MTVEAAFEFIKAGGAGPASASPSPAGIITLAALVAFITCVAFSMGPFTWTAITEVLPSPVRVRAVAVTTAVNCGSAFLVSQEVLTLAGAIDESFSFWTSASICGVGLGWGYVSVPEAKGRSLKEVQQTWKTKGA